MIGQMLSLVSLMYPVDELRSTGHIHFSIDIVDMRLNGPFRNMQAVTNRLV